MFPSPASPPAAASPVTKSPSPSAIHPVSTGTFLVSLVPLLFSWLLQLLPLVPASPSCSYKTPSTPISWPISKISSSPSPSPPIPIPIPTPYHTNTNTNTNNSNNKPSPPPIAFLQPSIPYPEVTHTTHTTHTTHITHTSLNMKYTITSLLAIASLSSAHFNLDFPKARDFDENTLVQFPCGGFNTPSNTRTPWPLSGGQIALRMGHSQSNIEVLIALGDNPGSAFNTVIRPTFLQTGLGAFCMTGLTLPSSLNVTEGTNATIQVITNGDPDGGLYNCADITFSSTAAAAGSCTNATGVTVGTATVSGNPNGTATTSDTAPPAGSSSSTTKPGSASGVKAGMGGLAVAVVAAVAMVM